MDPGPYQPQQESMETVNNPAIPPRRAKYQRRCSVTEQTLRQAVILLANGTFDGEHQPEEDEGVCKFTNCRFGGTERQSGDLPSSNCYQHLQSPIAACPGRDRWTAALSLYHVNSIPGQSRDEASSSSLVGATKRNLSFNDDERPSDRVKRKKTEFPPSMFLPASL
jgi:hypothetical protein